MPNPAVNQITYGDWVKVAPYSGPSCKHFCHSTGKCAKGIVPPLVRTKRSAYWDSMNSCGLFTFCRSWEAAAHLKHYTYSSMDYHAWVFVSYNALEYLKKLPYHGGLYHAQPGDVIEYDSWCYPGIGYLEFEKQLIERAMAD